MSREEIDIIVAEFREQVCAIDNDEAEFVIELCKRKIQLTKQSEDYMKVLLPDELRNYCLRRAINATTILRKLEKEGFMCARCAEAIHA